MNQLTDVQKAALGLIHRYGGLRLAAAAREIDPAYLSRLARGKKSNPGDITLKKLGLIKSVTYRKPNGRGSK